MLVVLVIYLLLWLALVVVKVVAKPLLLLQKKPPPSPGPPKLATKSYLLGSYLLCPSSYLRILRVVLFILFCGGPARLSLRILRVVSVCQSDGRVFSIESRNCMPIRIEDRMHKKTGRV